MSSTDPINWMWTEACALLGQAERMRSGFSNPGFTDSRSAAWEPPLDIYETDREICIYAAMPGVAADDLDIRFNQDTLIIAGRRTLPLRLRGVIVHRLEIPHGRFERRITLAETRVRLSSYEIADGCLALYLKKSR